MQPTANQKHREAVLYVSEIVNKTLDGCNSELLREVANKWLPVIKSSSVKEIESTLLALSERRAMWEKIFAGSPDFWLSGLQAMTHLLLAALKLQELQEGISLAPFAQDSARFHLKQALLFAGMISHQAVADLFEQE